MKNYTLLLIICNLFAALMACTDETSRTPPEHDGVNMGTKINHTRELRTLIQSDPHRPSYHFVSPEGRAYPFDPNGAIFWKGKYHLGFIYQYLGNGKREHFWGHAVSRDLFHWTLLPDMLDVKDGDIEEGIFSGGAFLSREGIPHIMYHGQGSSTNLVAHSNDDELRVWNKFKGNPVLVTPEEGDPLYGKYRAWDPEGWYDPQTDYYYQISGGEVAAFFKSKDMLDWEYLGDLIDQNNRMRHDFEDLSCPDFFALGDKHMLLFISHNLGTQYYLGAFENGKFQVEGHDRMNWPGGTFFAPEQLVDDRGRNIIWGWVLERKPEHVEWPRRWSEEGENPQNFPSNGWSGIMSLPRVVSLADDGTVLINPPEEVKNLRMDGTTLENINIPANQTVELPVGGKALEIKAEIKANTSGSFGIKVFCSPDGKEETAIKYDPTTRELVIDFINSSVNGPVKMLPNCMREPELPGFTEDVSEQQAPFELQHNETLQLDIFIDKSLIEVFANGRLCMTQVVYPELPDSDRVKLFAGEESVVVRQVSVWKMAATNFY